MTLIIKHYTKFLAVASIVLAASNAGMTANANGLSFEQTQSITAPQTKQPKIYVVEQSLPDFLRQAARRNGYEITMTPRVRGTLKKMTLPLNIEEMLEKIAPQFDLLSVLGM